MSSKGALVVSILFASAAGVLAAHSLVVHGLRPLIPAIVLLAVAAATPVLTAKIRGDSDE